MGDFNHLNNQGEAHMVDVSAKQKTERIAIAQAIVKLNNKIMQQLLDSNNPKGEVISTARIAGIQAAKQCSNLIPLCHPVPLHKVSIDIDSDQTSDSLKITATCKTSNKTGVEMEALTAASIAALTIYDMCKAIDKGIIIQETKLLKKTGGKSGDWQA